MSNTETQATNTSSSKSPTHFAYHLREVNEKSHWTRIGAAWAHKDGNGFHIQVETLPLDGKITLRIAQEEKSAK